MAINRSFFIASVGQPGEGYDEDNLQRCIKHSCHAMFHKTKQKGVFNDVSKHSICFLKFKDNLIAYGEVEGTSTKADPQLEGWNWIIKVKEWVFFDKEKKRKGVSNYGVSRQTLAGSQMATIKEITPEYGLRKMYEIDNKSDLYKKVNIEINRKNNMNDLINLVKHNKNLILTGAPGTGKTYLAKQIAEKIIKSTPAKSALSILKNKIDSFVINDELRKNQADTLKVFQDKFPIEKLRNLTLEEYCTGRTNEYPNNFCNWIENGLTKHRLGGFMPGTSKSYRIYWSRDNQEYIKTGFLKDKTDEDAILDIRNLLADLVENKNFDQFTNFFGNSFAIKILNSYYPDEIFPINSSNHIENVLSLFKINETGNLLDKNKAVYSWFKELVKGKDITPFEFMNILYDNFNIKEGELISSEDTVRTQGEIDFIQFHPSFDYTDFVEGLRPTKETGENEIGFKLRNGIFKSFCKKAKNNPNKNYVFIIDEINRGEISNIFGELFFAIDPSYRGIKGKVKTQYANIQTEETRFADDLEAGDFFVPNNVYIIGTMNDIDRSIESFDFAMRRRFVWKEITAEESQQMFEGESWKEEAIKRMNNLNNKISNVEGLNSSYHIGGAYFKNNLPKYENNEKWEKLWNLHLRPLLFEYLRGMPNVDGQLNTLKNAYNEV